MRGARVAFERIFRHQPEQHDGQNIGHIGPMPRRVQRLDRKARVIPAGRAFGREWQRPGQQRIKRDAESVEVGALFALMIRLRIDDAKLGREEWLGGQPLAIRFGGFGIEADQTDRAVVTENDARGPQVAVADSRGMRVAQRARCTDGDPQERVDRQLPGIDIRC
nr:hypothetical protein [Paraburkholderia tropica]